jgi:hypothetical protein
MPKLDYLVKGLQQTQAKLDSAAEMKGGLSESIGKRLEESNKMLVGVLKEIVTEQTNGALFSSSVHQTVLSITQNNQLLLRSLEKITMAVEKEVTQSNKQLAKEVVKVGKAVGSVDTSLSGQINNLAKSVERLPTQYPKQKETDLSGINSAIKAVGNAVMNIPKPPVVNIKPEMANLEKRLDKRVHTFEIGRDPTTGGIKKITVSVK